MTTRSAWITSYNDFEMDLLNPTVAMVKVDHVARSLSRKIRWNGFLDVGTVTDLDDNYTVAQHSVYVGRMMGPDVQDRLLGFAHDWPEFVLGDSPTPLKKELPDYKHIEALWEPVCYEAAGAIVTPERMKKMHDADHYVLMMERHQFGRTKNDTGAFNYPKLFDFFEGDKVMKPSDAYMFFMDEYCAIKNEIDGSVNGVEAPMYFQELGRANLRKRYEATFA